MVVNMDLRDRQREVCETFGRVGAKLRRPSTAGDTVTGSFNNPCGRRGARPDCGDGAVGSLVSFKKSITRSRPND